MTTPVVGGVPTLAQWYTMHPEQRVLVPWVRLKHLVWGQVAHPVSERPDVLVVLSKPDSEGNRTPVGYTVVG